MSIHPFVYMFDFFKHQTNMNQIWSDRSLSCKKLTPTSLLTPAPSRPLGGGGGGINANKFQRIFLAQSLQIFAAFFLLSHHDSPFQGSPQRVSNSLSNVFPKVAAKLPGDHLKNGAVTTANFWGYPQSS